MAVRPRGLRVEASAPSLFAIVRWGVFEEIVRRNPEVSLRLLRVLGERIGILEARLGELAYKGVQARLANAIMRLIEGRRIRVTDREALERVAEDGETS